MNMKTYLVTTAFVFAWFLSFGQFVANYDVRFNMHEFDCNTSKLFIDIEVKATPGTANFNMSEQNFRFSYMRDVVEVGSMQIDTMFLQDFITQNIFNSTYNSFYATHTLTGSIDTVSSYNVELAGGDGYLNIMDVWTKVGRISMNILDTSKCVELIWHTHAPEDFPPTFIGEKVGGILYEVEEGNYYNANFCLDEICANLPIELTYFKGEVRDCEAQLSWQTLTETNNEYFVIEASTDGEVYEVYKTIDGAGTSIRTLNYETFVEMLAPTTYFRLKQVDFDGTYAYSDVVILRSDCMGGQKITLDEAALYPNPVGAQESLNLVFKSNENIDNAQIVINDVLGRNVYTSTRQITQGLNNVTLNVSQLSAGTYFLSIISDKNLGIQSKRFIKIIE